VNKRQRKKRISRVYPSVRAALRAPWRRRSIQVLKKFEDELQAAFQGYIGTYYNCRFVKEQIDGCN